MATWTDLTFSFGSLLTSTKMTQLDDNLDALAEGASGTPEIVEAALADSVIAQIKLKTTMGSVSTTGAGNLTLPGGSYGFYPQLKALAGNDPAEAKMLASYTNIGTTFITTIYLDRGPGGTFFAQQRYIQSSPPYDLGDGDIPLFTFVVIDNTTGAVEIVYTAYDPPWANNGPTIINPLGRIQKLAKVPGQFMYLTEAQKIIYFNELDKAINMTLTEIKAELEKLITQQEKQADMPLIPHPFTGSDLTGKTVLLLDPVGTFSEKCHQISRFTGDNINEILHKGHIIIDNQPLSIITPPGVIAVNARFKLT